MAIVRAVAEMIPNISESERQEIEKEVEEAMDEEDSAIKRIAQSLLLAGKGGGNGEITQGMAEGFVKNMDGGAVGGGETDA